MRGKMRVLDMKLRVELQRK